MYRRESITQVVDRNGHSVSALCVDEVVETESSVAVLAVSTFDQRWWSRAAPSGPSFALLERQTEAEAVLLRLRYVQACCCACAVVLYHVLSWGSDWTPQETVTTNPCVRARLAWFCVHASTGTSLFCIKHASARPVG